MRLGHLIHDLDAVAVKSLHLVSFCWLAEDALAIWSIFTALEGGANVAMRWMCGLDTFPAG